MSDQPTDTVDIGPPGAAKPLSLARGASVGRYVILEPVGSGGMGVVFAAYDPELDRKVALKLLRPGRAGEAARQRLLREAQAVARLAHPNVVAVHDAGSIGEQVFMAMELVQGQTLRDWLEERPRPWREVLGRLLPAGRGLAAAHAAGLIHRDVKPENVLLGTDGRVRMADFGLVRRTGAAEEAEPLSESPEPSLLATPLTGHGMAVGTPSYMAPEQRRGEPADPRSDQYGFCVTLWEGLFGKRPPAGDDRRVPSWLRQALLRGLSDDPAGRYPSMEALLADLGRDPAALRRRRLAAVAVVLAAGAAWLAWERGRESRAELCSGAEARLAGVWDDGRKQAIHASFVATGSPVAEEVWRLARGALDAHTARWTAMRREACEATRLRGEQSEDLLDRRMFCLDQRLQEVAAVSTLFTRADAKLLEKAVSIASSLPGLETCADAAALAARLPPPRDPALRSRVEQVRGRVAEARAMIDAGRIAEGLPKARAAADLARRLGYGPLTAEALFYAARLQEMSGDGRGAEPVMFDALVAAQASGHQEMAARAASQLSWIAGFEQSRFTEGHRWARLAQAIAEGARGSDTLRGDLLTQLASVLGNERSYPEAAAVARRALELTGRSLGPENTRVAILLTNLSVFQNQMGHQEEALRLLLRGLEIRKKVLPAGHPDFGRSYNNLGNIYTDLHRDAEALAAFDQALEIYRRHYGPGHWLVAGALTNRGLTHKNLGHLAEALRDHQEARLRFEALYGPEHPWVAMTFINTGEVLLLQGKPAEALAACQHGLAIQEKTLDPGNPDLAEGLTGVVQALLALGRAREAVPLAERALALREGREIKPSLLSEARFELARALWDGGGDRTRARRLARLALPGFGPSAVSVAQKEQAAAWLAARSSPGPGVPE